MKAKKLDLKVALSNLDRGLVVEKDTSDAEFRKAASETCRAGTPTPWRKSKREWCRRTHHCRLDARSEHQCRPGSAYRSHVIGGNCAEGTMLSELLLSVDPDNTGLLFNLGMALSDRRKLDRAVFLLRRAIEIEPVSSDAQVALAVALERSGNTESAIQQLLHAIEVDPSNSYAHRNLAALLGRLGQLDDSREHFVAATELNPSDQRAWLGLAKAEEAGNSAAADLAYLATIKQGEHTESADIARQARSRIAEANFRSAEQNAPRMDAVMYCLGALRLFAEKSVAEVQRITFEIAMLGERGLQVNDATRKYTLKSLPGEFSGLHLVCIEYVGFKKLNPTLDMDSICQLSIPWRCSWLILAR